MSETKKTFDVFMHVESILRKDHSVAFKAQWVTRRTGTVLYVSKVCATEEEARQLALNYLNSKRGALLVDTTTTNR
jgi:hypothetical protein